MAGRTMIPWWWALLAFYGGVLTMGLLASSSDEDHALTRARRKAIEEDASEPDDSDVIPLFLHAERSSHLHLMN